MLDNEECYTMLRCAVIVQAARDYKTAQKFADVSPTWAHELKKLKEFFAGGGTWHLWAGDIDAKYILRHYKDIRKGREL